MPSATANQFTRWAWEPGCRTHHAFGKLCRLSIILLGFFVENAEFKAASSTQPQAVQSASAERLLQEGLQAYRAHRLAPAVAKLRRAYQLASGNPKIRLTLGLMLYE